MSHPPVCNYEDSDYQSTFWDSGSREYEDRVEAIALKRLLPTSGRLLLELGAGAGRNTLRYTGFERIVLLDYSRTQLEQAQAHLGKRDQYVYVAADVYRLPFVDGLFDAATMIRTLHHMADPQLALGQVESVLRTNGIFILEFANKLNSKAILRYWLGKQAWNPFTLESVEFAKLNFDFHPREVQRWLQVSGFRIQTTLAVSHFRMGFLKRALPTSMLVFFDSLVQWTGALWQLTPSVFIRSSVAGQISESRRPLPRDVEIPANPSAFFKCPACGHSPLTDKTKYLGCPSCKRKWEIKDGIYDFRMDKAY
jgi:ubiquinone/menaquinone biosynthesis C-methylase UbiE